MKNLLLAVVVFLFGCNSSDEIKKDYVDVVVENTLQFEPLPLPELITNISHSHNGSDEYDDILSSRYNGSIGRINDNSWVYTSHLNSSCTAAENPDAVLFSPCRRVNDLFKDDVASNRVIKTNFVFNTLDFNLDDAPYWVIIWQDWLKMYPDTFSIYPDSHPMTTIKLKVFDGKLYLAHYDNSWQWGYDHSQYYDSYEGGSVDHSLHQENRLNGKVEIELGVEYNVELINYDSGRFIFKVNDMLISDVEYQTKSVDGVHAIQWGLYWSKGYNVDNDPLKRIVIRIDDFKRSIAYD